MNFPKELQYTKSHEWVKFLDKDTVLVGLTDFAQHALGDIVFVNLPEKGDSVTAGESFAEVESVKAVSDIISPVSGEISAVNDEAANGPQKINSDPYGVWLVTIKNIKGTMDMLDSAGYEAFCAEEE